MLLSIHTLQVLIVLYSFIYTVSVTAFLYLLAIVMDDANTSFNFDIFSTDTQLHIAFVIILGSLCGLPPFFGF